MGLGFLGESVRCTYLYPMWTVKMNVEDLSPSKLTAVHFLTFLTVGLGFLEKNMSVHSSHIDVFHTV